MALLPPTWPRQRRQTQAVLPVTFEVSNLSYSQYSLIVLDGGVGTRKLCFFNRNKKTGEGKAKTAETVMPVGRFDHVFI